METEKQHPPAEIRIAQWQNYTNNAINNSYNAYVWISTFIQWVRLESRHDSKTNLETH